MSVSVSMPQLGESVTEGTVTRWLKKEGERVEADEPLLEVSTDKVDTEIPSPVAGILRGITVAEDETVAVGAELAVIDEEGAAPPEAPAGGSPAAASEAPAAPANGAPPAPADSGQAQQRDQAQQPYQQGDQAPQPYQQAGQGEQPYQQAGQGEQPYQPQGDQAQQPYQQGGQAPPVYQQQPPSYPPPSSYQQPPSYPQAYPPPAYEPPPPAYPQQPAAQQPEQAQQPAPQHPAVPAQAAPPQSPAETTAPPAQGAPAQDSPAQDSPAQGAQDGQAQDGQAQAAGSQPPPSQADGPYVTPLVRKLATEHGIDLAAVSGTGVGGRIRKQDVLDAARDGRGSAAPAPASAPAAATGPPSAPAQQAPPAPPVPQAPAAQSGHSADGSADSPQAADNTAAGRPAIVPSSLRGTTVQLSRARQVIAKRMVESLHVSAQLTTVVEADVTEIARLRQRAKAAFESREGVKLSFLPFFALAAVEALKVHPRLNAVIDTESAQVTYHDAEHLGIAVDTDRGLMVPVIRQAGDLNIGGLARKIADLAERTRSGRVSPDDLSGGTFTLTNTGSRGALFDTPIINQPQVAILGTGTVVKRPVVVEDPALGEVITVRSMVYLALTYDHRLVDGADAARFLVTMKSRLEEGAFETELGL